MEITTLKEAYADLLLKHILDILEGKENLEEFYSDKNGYGLTISHVRLVEHMEQMHKDKRKLSYFKSSIMMQPSNGYMQFRTNIPSRVIRDQELKKKDHVEGIITKIIP